MALLVVIVNYRTAALTLDCLESLAAERADLAFTVVVVDNASGDDSVARLTATVHERGWDVWATVCALEQNHGFAAGNNAAIGPALRSEQSPESILLLNPDTVVRRGAIPALVAFLEQHPEAGIVGSRLEDPDGAPQRAAFRFPSVLGELEGTMRSGPATKLLRRWVVAFPAPESACPVDWVAGACMLVRREVFEAIGLLDEGYFLYYEEVDFCRRARNAGWACWHFPEARVVHLVGQSSGVTDPTRTRKRRPAYWFVSRRRYFRRHAGRSRALLADLAWLLGLIVYRARRALDRRPNLDPSHLLRDFVRHTYAGTRS